MTEQLLNKAGGLMTLSGSGRARYAAAPIISMETYNRVLWPYHQKLIDPTKTYQPLIIHTCGSSSWVYEALISMGMNGIDTLRPEATSMASAYLAFGAAFLPPNRSHTTRPKEADTIAGRVLSL